MLNRLVYFIVMISLLAASGLFIIKQPNGEPWLSWSDFTPDKETLANNRLFNKAEQLTDTALTHVESLVAAPKGKTQHVYRWQDGQGQWHYSDKPHSNSELVTYDSDAITRLPKLEPPMSQQHVEKPHDLVNENRAFITSPSQALHDAKQVQQLMDRRQLQLEQKIKQSQ
ncbi:DUF4124 domain-containing protein [Psychrobium sp. 1_MG-2023]|uniref:DUF4124 domain-containing protein n=1 Tax=Psychrobium sp. 1_MG-2023 TaxID=3062624 RepID=UPI000C343C64|nr:DUF4124 domain-containing protein [Psychrobium sp. 1_MG-2023]MDP2561231.1 DUF4124 domain-containing protein [Psychrobium sp. 1_MG-2023]PKF55266.1 hypothetical protein CW748_13685 [Alteromonadales bacterium alter-6D02]